MHREFDGAPRGASRKYDLAMYALALIPALTAVTTGLNGVLLGAAALIAMLGTSLLVSALWRFSAQPARGFAQLLFAAVLASMVQMVASVALTRYATSLGLYLPLTAFLAALTAFPETFDEEREFEESLVRALGRGTLFLIALTVLGCVREVLGGGAIFGVKLGDDFQPMRMLSSAPGGFILAGVVLALIRVFTPKRSKGGEGA